MQRSYQILVTTSLRSGRRIDGRGEETSGSLLLGTVDVEAQTFQFVKSVDVPESPHRPGRNSVRGAAPFGGGFAVCNTSQLFAFDRDLTRITGMYSEKRFGDIHSIAARDGILYVTATASDSIIGVDRELNKVFEWWAGSEAELAPHMNKHPMQAVMWDHDFRVRGPYWNRFHINHVLFDTTGDLIVNLPNLDTAQDASKLWNVTRHRFHMLGGSTLNPMIGKIHDGTILGNYHYLAHTQKGAFLKLSKETGELLQSVDCSLPLGETTGNPVAIEHGWLRGAVHLYDEVFLVGQSKLTMYLVDMACGTRSDPLTLVGVPGDLGHPGLAIYCMTKTTVEDGAGRRAFTKDD